MKSHYLIALAGNPNCGKTTLFNALTGAHHQVGNYPGVTVEKREGTVRRVNADGAEIAYHFVDLPGIYSLTAYSEDEVVSRDFLLDEKPDVIIDVLDSTNLERNLYLCLQMQELGIPVVGALNMMDEAEKNGIRIDEGTLQASLGIPFVKIIAQHGRGIEKLLDAVDAVDFDRLNHPNSEAKSITYGEEIEAQLESLVSLLGKELPKEKPLRLRWLAIKLLEKDTGARKIIESYHDMVIDACVAQAIAWIENHFGKDSEIVISEQRYGYIHGAVAESRTVMKQPDFSLTEKIDSVLMNRFLALPIFVLVLWGVFQLTFTLGAYPQGWVESFFGFLSNLVTNILPEGEGASTFLRSLLVDGIIAGVGGVTSFVPLIIILFFLLSLLEDLGYMSRAAFATDKLLHTFGLHGQSIFPMMLGFGCSVPAIMAARTLKSRRDRIITILITPMMSCGAKLPVHVLFAAAFFPKNPVNMVMLLYACGIVGALASAAILRKTVLRGDPTPFVLELPPYRLPTLRGVLWHVWEKTASYIKKAGTIILATSIFVWVITTFPQYNAPASPDGTAISDAPSVALEHSFAGMAGRAIEPLFRPLGFNWKMAIATITGFSAKEVVVSTLGVLYRQADDAAGDGDETLTAAIAADPDLSPLHAFVFMLFTLLIPPCFAALAAIKAEAGWKWLIFEICFLLITGWLVGFAVFQIGSLVV